MITAKFSESRDRVELNVVGHGDPIVCAAVSALTINAANSVSALTASKTRGEGGADGFINFTVEYPDDGARLLMESLKLGLTAVSEKHPEDLTVKAIKLR